MPLMSRVALTLGLTLGAAAAPNSIAAPKGAESLTLALLGGKSSIFEDFRDQVPEQDD